MKSLSQHIGRDAYKLGVSLFERIPKSSDPSYNAAGEFVCQSKETAYRDIIEVFTLAIKHRGNTMDYFFRGRAYAELADVIAEDKKEELYRKAVHDFETTISIKSEAPDLHWRGSAKSMLSDYVDTEEQVKLLNEAIEDLSQAIEMRGLDIDYHWIAATRIELADHQPFEERKKSLYQAIEELETMKTLDPEDHFWMGVGKSMLAEVDPSSEAILRREAIDHLRRAYEKIQDEYTEELIEEIESRM